MVSPSKSLYTAEQAVQWLAQIADGLAYMHALDPTVSSRCTPLQSTC